MSSYEKFSHARRQKFTPRMKVISGIFLVFLLSVASPVLPRETFDILVNSELYPFPPYSFQSHFRHSIQVKVNKDTCSYPENIAASNPAGHLERSFWSEDVAVMVERVLEREFLLSNLFDSVSRHDDRSSLVLEIDLNLFSAAWERGTAGLKPILTLYSAVNMNASLTSRKDGKILLLRNYLENTHSEATRFRHKEKHAATEAGKALKKVIVSMVNDVKHRMESVETEPNSGREEPPSHTKKPVKKQKTSSREQPEVKKQPPQEKTTPKKRGPKKGTDSRKSRGQPAPQKDPIPVVLDPVGPK